MITVKCKKSCPWGIHHAWGPTFQIEPDMVLTTEEWPDNTNSLDWKNFIQKLLDAGHAVQVPNAEPAEQDNQQDNPDDTKEPAEGGNTENSVSSESGSSDTTGDNSDDPNANKSAEANGDTIEVTPETLKAELEGIALKELDGPMGSDKAAKEALEAISKERYAFDVDKRMSVDNIIEAIVAKAFEPKDDEGNG